MVLADWFTHQSNDTTQPSYLGHLQEGYKALFYLIWILKFGDIEDETFVCHGEALVAKDRRNKFLHPEMD